MSHLESCSLGAMETKTDHWVMEIVSPSNMCFCPYQLQFHQLALGHCITVGLTTSGHVFTMGSAAYGQLGNPRSNGKLPCLVQDRLVGEFVEEISCGAYHVAVLTSRSEVFTWGRGANGRLGHGDTEDRKTPTLVEALKDRHLKNISCGSSYTATIWIHKWVSGADQSVCSGCRQAFGFTRKRHNCYNCGLVHCHACSSKKALKAALAPTPGKPHRVCDSCYAKLKSPESVNPSYYNRRATAPHRSIDSRERSERGENKSGGSHTKFIQYLEVKSAKAGTKTDSYSIVRASQVPALIQLTDIAFPSSLSALQYAFKPPPQPQPPPRSGGNSRSSSPYSRRPSPPRSATPVFSRGIKSLKQKSEVEDEEIQKLQKNAQEATFLADQESSKFIVANEVMKSVASQLKEIAGKFPPEMPMSDTLEDINAQFETFFLSTNRDAVSESRSSLPVDLAFDQRHESAYRQYRRTEDNLDVTGVSDVSQNGEGTPRHSNRSSNIREALHLESNESAAGSLKSPKSEGQREVIEQFEPGVYVTLIQLHNGTKIFKRVRFRYLLLSSHASVYTLLSSCSGIIVAHRFPF
ncbi:hypothetical protein Vadar_006502 [Vaccinium darrowii]|uniref:Uncharacterized protein n=1 Tax=Vaccinium darrowii TaxID=229202 RepID=A0ACB7YTQ8_9ERIC|nr:hypothetical protein Vadar_006502 [Vaccinium darrowii]